jgi:hypothetical protein
VTAADKADLVNRLTRLTKTITTWPDSIPDILSVSDFGGWVLLGLGYPYSSKPWATIQKLAQLASALNVPPYISRSGSRIRLSVEFRDNDINFKAGDDLSTANARALAKALGVRLPAVANPAPIAITATALFEALKSLDSA